MALGVAATASLLLLQSGAVRAVETMGRPEHPRPTQTLRVFGVPVASFPAEANRFIQPEVGLCATYPVIMPESISSGLWADQDNVASQTSRTVVFEDGTALPQPHSIHDAIRQEGRGRFSHWGEKGNARSFVYFSALDGSNPANNGRTYTIEWRPAPRPWVASVLGLVGLPLYVVLIGWLRRLAAAIGNAVGSMLAGLLGELRVALVAIPRAVLARLRDLASRVRSALRGRSARGAERDEREDRGSGAPVAAVELTRAHALAVVAATGGLATATAWWFWRPFVSLVAEKGAEIIFAGALALALIPMAGTLVQRLIPQANARFRRWPWLALGLAASAFLAASHLGAFRVVESMNRRGNPAPSTKVTLFSRSSAVKPGAARFIEPEVGLGATYAVDVPEAVSWFLWAGQDNSSTQTSRAVVWEDGIPLKKPHSAHDAIRHEGRGRFSHWGKRGSARSFVYLSASDGSNPASNSRRYEIEYRLLPKPWLGWLALLASAPFWLVALTSISSLAAGVKRALPVARPASLALVACCALCLFLFPLTETWRRAPTDGLVIGGLLPWSDASAYFSSAVDLVQGEGLRSIVAERRPLYPLFLGGLLQVMGSLRAALVVQAVLVTTACLLVAWTLNAIWGRGPGVAALGVLIGAGRLFVHATLTETLGLALGAAAFAIMLPAIATRRWILYAAGLFVLALMVFVRPGPILILPALVLWPLVAAGETLRQRLRIVALAAVAVGCAWGANYAVFRTYGAGSTVPGGNYAFTFYGLVHGGKPWQSFVDDYPEVEGTTRFENEGAAVAAAYRAAFRHLRERPGELVDGLEKFARLYLGSVLTWVPSFASALRLLAVVGLVAAIISRRAPVLDWLAISGLAIALSAPWIFWSPDATRAFIPTAPFEAALVAYGLHTVVRLVRGGNPGELLAAPSVPPALVLGATLTALCTVIPAVVVGPGKRQNLVPQVCDDGRPAVILDPGRGSPYIRLTGAALTGENWAPVVSVAELRRDLGAAGAILPFLRELQGGDILIQAHDLLTQTDPARPRTWIAARSSDFAEDAPYYAVCHNSRMLGGHEVAVATSVRVVAPPP